MKLTDEKLKQLFQEKARRAVEQRNECLSAEELQLAASGKLSFRMRAHVADHLMSCANCVAEYQVLHSLKEWADEEAAAFDKITVAPQKEKANRLSWLQWFAFPRWAAAFAVFFIAAVSVSLWIWQTRQETPNDSERGPGLIEIKAEPANRVQLSEIPQRLSWKSEQTESNYKVALYDYESSLIWESGLIKETSIEIPADVRAKLQRGRVYYWRVFFVNGFSRQSQILQFSLVADAR